ncbi:regulator of G-protein signaling [Pimephales promelas]|nr:regulator of G-protein signaling [Pimephales promelas]
MVDPNLVEIMFTQQCIMRPRVKSSVSIGALVKYSTTYTKTMTHFSIPASQYEKAFPSCSRVSTFEEPLLSRTFLARGAPRWINIDGKTMDITVKGLVWAISEVPVFKETQKKAIAPEAHRFSETQLEQNSKRRRPSLSPIMLRQQQEEQKAKLAASGPVDITQLCRFTAPVPHLAVYTGFCEAQSIASPGLMTLPNSAACPSPISVAIDSTPASERRFDGNGGPSSSHFPSIAEASVSEEENQPPAPKSRVALSLGRLLRRGCNAPSVFASLSPKCAVASGGGKVQPLGVEPLTQPQPRRIANFFQIKVDIPPECRIYPIDSEDEEDDSPDAARRGVKEIICPWETVSKQDGARS